jgi:hypothetical protein
MRTGTELGLLGVGLPGQSASVVYGKAMLTMQSASQKRKIVQEASRILKSGGRYGIHELCLVPGHLRRAAGTWTGGGVGFPNHEFSLKVWRSR